MLVSSASGSGDQLRVAELTVPPRQVLADLAALTAAGRIERAAAAPG